MIKINNAIQKSLTGYIYKNTVRAKYNRSMDTAFVSGLAAGAELIRIPSWEPHDFGLFAFVGSIYLRSAAKAVKHLIELQPIRKRAIKIKKAAKNNKI